MGKDKLRKFAEVSTFKNVVQLDAGKEYKGKWAKEFFQNEKPLILELACGKGEYTVNLAKLFPERILLVLTTKGTGSGVVLRLP